MSDSWSIPKPKLTRIKTRKDNYDGPKFFVALILPIAAVFATYYGLIKVPVAAGSSIMAFVVLVAVVGFMVYALNQPSKLWQWAAVLVALVAGIMIAANWATISAALGNFNFGDVFVLIVALVVLFVFAFWVSKKPATRVSTSPSVRPSAQPGDTRASRRQQGGTPNASVHEVMGDRPDSTSTTSAQ
jgi:drug/metabolite transporter (DMT)-like permease